MRILVVEDDREVGSYLKKGLTESGHAVTLEEAGREGLDRAVAENFDALVIDRMLPGLDAVVRRAGAETRLKVGDLELDLLSRRVTRGGNEIELLPREFRLLEYLMRHAGQAVTRNMLLERVWDHHFDPQTNVIDVHVSRLRQKIDKGFAAPLLHTIRGSGYSLRPAEPQDAGG